MNSHERDVSGGGRPAGTGPGGELPGPSGTTTRFALLVMAVIATSGVIFLSLYTAVPSHGVRLASAREACERQLDNSLPAAGPGDAGDRAQALVQFRRCLVPADLAWDTWAGYGVLIVFALAVVLYGLHPWRKINGWRFRGWRPVRQIAHLLPIDADPGLTAALAELSREAGLSRQPVWLLSYQEPGERGTTGAAAFGLPWRRYVRLDPGLVVLRATDRGAEAFRATVRHELAHLSNRDVDKTFATRMIWQAFVAAAVLPFLILGPRNPGETAAVLGLTLLVYLTRCSILRLRELHADATAAALGDSGRALNARLSVSGKAPGFGRPSWLNRHPDSARRVAVLNDPSVLACPSWWEMAGVGVAAGVLAANAGSLLNNVILASSLGPALGGALGAVPAIGLLAATLWRAMTGCPRRPGGWMAMPSIAIAAGFSVGDRLAFINSASVSYFSGASLAALCVVTIGGMLLTCWIVAAFQSAGAPGPPRRAAFQAVAATAILAGAPWFAVWFGFWSVGDSLLAPGLGPPPETGGFIGWYRLWTEGSGLTWPPLQWVNAIPVTLPGLALLWLVPFLLIIRSRGTARVRVPVWPALGAALAGAGITAVVNVCLADAAKVVLPVAVRISPAPGVFFDSVYSNSEIIVAVLVEAAVAAAVVTWFRQYQIPAAVLAVTVTAALNTLAIPLVSDSIAKCMNVFGNKPASYPALTLSCVRMPPTLDNALTLHQLTTEGLIAAIPAALLAYACTARYRRRGPAAAVAVRPGDRHWLTSRALTPAALALVLAVSLAAPIILLPHDGSVWWG